MTHEEVEGPYLSALTTPRGKIPKGFGKLDTQTLQGDRTLATRSQIDGHGPRRGQHGQVATPRTDG